MQPDRPSSIPPARKRHLAVTALIGSLAALLGAVATRVATMPTETPSLPRAIDKAPAPGEPEAKPIPVPPKEPPTTDDGVVAARLVREHANQALIEHRDQLQVDEAELCAIKADLRELYARMVELQAGKRGAAARTDFEDRTVAWALCTPGKRIELRALREAADSALRRR
jgi:hypothetical protein